MTAEHVRESVLISCVLRVDVYSAEAKSSSQYTMQSIYQVDNFFAFNMVLEIEPGPHAC